VIRVRVFNAHRARRIRRAAVAEAVRGVARGERRRDAAFSVVFVGDRATAAMNRQYLGHAGSTDVISFPLGEGRAVEGEVYVNLDRARVQARRYGVPISEEVCRLVVHGTLHLLGEDDTTAAARRRMKRKEDAYVALLGRAGNHRWL